MHEFNEPFNVDSFEELDITFGDEGHGFQFDGDDEMLDDETSAMLCYQSPQPDPICDENMNDIAVPNADQGYISFERDAQLPVQNTTVAEEHPKPSYNLLSQLPPVRNEKKSKKNLRYTIFMDTEKVVPGELMKRRISNAFVSCKKRISVSIQEQPLHTLKKKPIDLFATPTINGIHNQKMFAERATIKPVENDWTIIQDIFERSSRETSIVNGENNAQDSHVTVEVDILRNVSESQRKLRPSLNIDEPSLNKRKRSSMPIRPISRQSIRCSTPLRYDSAAQTPNLILSPPSHLQQWNSGSEINLSHPLAPPIDFDDDHQSNFELQTAHQQEQQSNQRNATEFDISEIEFEKRPSLIALLGENSLEYVIISKLIYLWE